MDLEETSDKILSELAAAGQLDGFKNLKGNNERVKWILDHAKAFDRVHQLIVGRDGLNNIQCKSEEKAKELRLEGNKLFAAKRFTDSLLRYNRAILMAPARPNKAGLYPTHTSELALKKQNGHIKATNGINGVDSELSEKRAPDCTGKDAGIFVGAELSLALANRSAALFHLKRYRESVVDSLTALEAGYSPELRPKLYERLARCYQHLGQISDAKEALEFGVQMLHSQVAEYYESQQKAKENVQGKGDESKHKNGKSLESFLLLKAELERINLPTSCKKGICVDAVSTKNATPTADDVTINLLDALEIRTSERCGRYTIAKRDVSVGDVISAGLPHVCTLYPALSETHCHHCVKPITLPYPCAKCMDAIYCSPRCRECSWTQYHHHECGLVLDVVMNDRMCKTTHLALRLLLIGGVENVARIFGDKKEMRAPRNGEVFGEGDLSYEAVVTGLVGHVDDRDWKTDFQMCCVAVFLFKLLKHCGIFQDQVNRYNKSYTENTEPGNHFHECEDSALNSTGNSLPEEAILLALLHHIQLLQCNAFVISDMRYNDEYRGDLLLACKLRDVALALYPNQAMPNHSCDPSVDLVYSGPRMIMRAIRTIRAGEEVTVDYGQLFVTTAEPDRKLFLSTQYYFDCQCRACSAHWPVWEELAHEKPVFRCPGCGDAYKRSVCMACKREQSEEEFKQAVQRLESGHDAYSNAVKLASAGNITEAIPMLCSHLANMQELLVMPWREFYNCQATLRQCYMILTNRGQLSQYCQIT